MRCTSIGKTEPKYKPGTRRLVALALLCIFDVTAASEGKTYRIPFRSVNGMILLDVKVNGSPAKLLLDTGANHAVLSPKIAGADKREAVRATHDWMFLTHSVYIEVVPGHLLSFSAMVADMAQRSRIDIDGLLGEDVLREFSAVRIDYKYQVLELEP